MDMFIDQGEQGSKFEQLKKPWILIVLIASTTLHFKNQTCLV
jgi:hypothetical protein